jgi:hypothetical protein
MFRKIFILTAIVILFSGYVYAEDPQDGVWWNNLDMGQKKIYIAGVSDGIRSGAIVLSLQKNDDKKCEALVKGSYKSFANTYIASITTTQVSNGLDLFYANYDNVNITVEKAFLIVLKTLHNDPVDEVRELIKTWRN